ncbi:MAG: FAD-binding oxidoreductase [Cyanobacteria bacterium P01_A01_bin.80]
MISSVKSYDITVIGAGIAGAAIAYELVKKGVSVLLLEQNPINSNLNSDSATRYSYGGLAFWSGTTELTRQLCDQGRLCYQNLPTELDTDIEFRELDLLLTIPTEDEPEEIAQSYQRFATPAKLLSPKEACELEPLLNQEAISGALTVKHGHINPIKTTQAYIQAFLRGGGHLEFASVLELQTVYKGSDSQDLQSITINTKKGSYHSANAIVCAGGFSRQLLKASAHKAQIAQTTPIYAPVYFTHAQIIATPPVDLKLHTLIMPASLQRFQLESTSTSSDEAWEKPGNKLGWILDAGAVQFLDGSLRIGQISSVFTDPVSTNPSSYISLKDSELALRQSIGKFLPALGEIPGELCRCLVAFSKDGLPLIGSVEKLEKEQNNQNNQNHIYLFSGFSNPLVIIPPLAKRFANFMTSQNKDDNIISQLSPGRFNS